MTTTPLSDDKVLALIYSYLMHLHAGAHPDDHEMREKLSAFLPSLHWRVYDYPDKFAPAAHDIDLPPVRFRNPHL